MYFLYIFIAVLGSLVCVFFLTRTLIILLSFFSKSPFVPSERALFERGIELLEINEGDKFLDIGCGDGRVVFSCVQKYPNAFSYSGIEKIYLLVVVANLKKLFSKKQSKIVFRRVDARKYSYEQYNKVFMYLLPEFVAELMPILQKQLSSKSIVVSIAFAIPDEYKKTGKLSIQEVKLGRKVKKIYVWKKK